MMKKERLMELAGVVENDQGQIVADQFREILGEVRHKADVNGAPPHFNNSEESAWFNGIEWAIDQIERLLLERSL